MKLYLILYVGTHIGGYWGPLPYEMGECHKRIAAFQEDINTAARTGRATNGTNEIIPAEHLERLKKTTLACELRRETPVLTLE